MPSTSSLTGIALSPVWHSIGSWSYGTGAIWNPGNWLQELSTSVWALCGGSRSKLPIAACSVRISLLAFAASKVQLDEWLRAAGIARGKIFRRVTRMGRTWGDCMTEKSIWHIVKDCANRIGMPKLAPHDLRRPCARLYHASGGELEQIQFLLGHVSVQTTERYLGCKQRIRSAVNDRIGIEPNT